MEEPFRHLEVTVATRGQVLYIELGDRAERELRSLLLRPGKAIFVDPNVTLGSGDNRAPMIGGILKGAR